MGCAAGVLGSAPTAAAKGLVAAGSEAAGSAVGKPATAGKPVVAGEGPTVGGVGPRRTCGLKE